MVQTATVVMKARIDDLVIAIKHDVDMAMTLKDRIDPDNQDVERNTTLRQEVQTLKNDIIWMQAALNTVLDSISHSGKSDQVLNRAVDASGKKRQPYIMQKA